MPGTGCDGRPGGGATSTAPEPATTSDKPPETRNRNDVHGPGPGNGLVLRLRSLNGRSVAERYDAVAEGAGFVERERHLAGASLEQVLAAPTTTGWTSRVSSSSSPCWSRNRTRVPLAPV